MGKYFYGGKPLKEYCMEHGMNPSSIYSQISKKKIKYPEKSTQEIVDMVIQSYTEPTKYCYQNQSLRQWCFHNHQDYELLISHIYSLKKTHPNLSTDEQVRIAVESFMNPKTKYYYRGIPFVEWCKMHPDISYDTFLVWVERKMRKNPQLDISNAIEEYIQMPHYHLQKYVYQDMPLKQYCKQNQMSYLTIIQTIYRYRRKMEWKDVPLDELIELVVGNYRPVERKYFYQGKTLFQYCKEMDLPYSRAIKRIHNEWNRDANQPLEEVISKVVQQLPCLQSRYCYQGIYLTDYCVQQGLNVRNIQQNIRNQLRKHPESDYLEEIVENCVQYALMIQKRKKIRETFQLAKKNQINDALLLLNIHEPSFRSICSCGFTPYQAMSILYYFSDIEVENSLSITILHFRDILKRVSKIDQIPLEDLDEYELYAFYKCDLYDTRYLYLEKKKVLIQYFIRNINNLKQYPLPYSVQREIQNELEVVTLELLDQCDIRIPGAFIQYIYKYLKWKCHNLIYQEIQNSKVSSLNRPVFQNSNSANAHPDTYLDVLVAKPIEPLDVSDSSFSSSTLKALASLSPWEIELVVKHYQENYSLEELAEYFDMNQDILEQREKEILNHLKTIMDPKEKIKKRRTP